MTLYGNKRLLLDLMKLTQILLMLLEVTYITKSAKQILPGNILQKGK